MAFSLGDDALHVRVFYRVSLVEVVIKDEVADLGDIRQAPPLAQLFGTILFFWWFVMLTTQGEGLDLDVQRRRNPMWEWLLSHPVRPEAAFLAEMVSPIVLPGVEEIRHTASLGIDAAQVSSFVKVAIDAGQREVLRVISPTMNFWNNMLDVEGCQRRIVLVKLTVFASVGGTQTHAGSQRPVHRYE